MEATNLLVIMSDQHSRHVLGAYGNPVVRTPHLDALARRGTTFANAYCNSPICVPSRASFATGRYVHATGNWDNAMPYLGTEAASWGHRLAAQGHRVATIGKLHYRAADDPTGFPEQHLPMHVLNGVGDLWHSLREAMPPRPESREHVLEARAGESGYTRYDRAIAAEGARWLREKAGNAGNAGDAGKPWVLFVSLVTPHFPLIAPEEFLGLYDPATLPLPVQHNPEDWPRHPALEAHRAQGMLTEPFDEATMRNAIAAYYGLVSFMDAQVGAVLDALDDAGLRESTRVVYTSDHGEMLGAHGLWWKSALYEGAAGVPLILAGPDVPVGKTVTTNISLVDCFPTFVEAVGASLAPEDGDLPGTSLWSLAREPDRSRVVFGEYHAIYASSGQFMLRDGRYKYLEYIGLPPQLFDLHTDPDEMHDLAADPKHADTLAACAAALRTVADPEAVDRAARADQARMIAAAGGHDAVVRQAVQVPYTPAPTDLH